MARLHREGKINFGDASLSIWEEGISDARQAGGWEGEKAWERQFKREVFLRIVQQLNRLGWTCRVPEDMIERYGVSFARNTRVCHKGDLKGELEVSGRCIKFDMWQDLHTPTRKDGLGKYESDKESLMPYVMRLEMERTRRRIRTYLCNVFDGYVASAGKGGRGSRRGPGFLTGEQFIASCYAESYHFKGVDWEKHKKQPGMSYNLKIADGTLLEHGQRVWGFDYKGRLFTGIAHYNINNMWWVLTGKYDVRNEHTGNLWSMPPAEPRRKRNEALRRKRLQQELAKATKAMNFERAAVLRDVLWSGKDQLFVVLHEDGAYHRPGFSGYTKCLTDAGKFTREEARGYDTAPNKLIPLEAA